MKGFLLFMLKTLILGVLLAALAIGGYKLVQKKKADLAAVPKYGMKPVPVQVAKATEGTVTERLEYLALCEPVRRSNVSARVMAVIEQVLCDEGTVVKKGQVLVRLDDRDVKKDLAVLEAEIRRIGPDIAGNEATVESLERSVAYWEKEARRDAKLAADGVIPESKAEATAEKLNEFRGKLNAARQKTRALKTQIEVLERRRKRLEVQLGYFTITSPYDGVITHKLVEPGDLAAPGKPLLVLEDRSALKLVFHVPQSDLASVRVGLAVGFEAGGERRSAELTEIYPALDPNRTVQAECALTPEAAAGLKCGAYVPVSVEVRRLEGVVLLPAACIISNPAGEPNVFLVRGDELERVKVKVLGRDGDRVAVEGVAAGEEAVASTFLGWAILSSGLKVEPVR